MDIIEAIKRILESEAGLIASANPNSSSKIIDNRFSLIKHKVDAAENKDDTFYAALIKLISAYIGTLYDKEIADFPSFVLDEHGEIVEQEYDVLNSTDMFNLTKANRELATQLFDYVCSILEDNKNIVLDVETLKKLLNRNPRLFSLSVEKDYLYRPFKFNRLITILNENHTIEKSNIGLDKLYQLLLDTSQIDNDDAFGRLVKPEQFKQNHHLIDEILMKCNAKTFAAITNIISHNFDGNFDRFSFVKKRNDNKFCEYLIIELLQWRAHQEDCDLIHQILTDPEIEIDYDLHFADFSGQSDLKSIIALSGNRTIISDLLSRKQNVQKYYWHGEQSIQLFILYAIISDYVKAIANFEKNYNLKDDFAEGDNNWDKSGYAFGSCYYEDSLARFISSLCASFKIDNLDYSIVVSLINRILNNKNVRYINLARTLAPIKKVLSDEDFKKLLATLLEKYRAGSLGFLAVSDHEGLATRYVIRIASEEEIQKDLTTINKKEESPSFIPTKKDQTD